FARTLRISPSKLTLHQIAQTFLAKRYQESLSEGSGGEAGRLLDLLHRAFRSIRDESSPLELTLETFVRRSSPDLSAISAN
ncbi:MAG: hypothetical protein KDD44_13860, partial [Bdellovibrionales bacterium]|nr:hypothetical protein [Bdellovibrionales bacterium]